MSEYPLSDVLVISNAVSWCVYGLLVYSSYC